MKMTITKLIGKRHYKFEVEGVDLHQCVMESQKLSFNDVYLCGLCKSDKLYLRAYFTEKDKYPYTKIQCADCKASITFGRSKKEKDTYFLRRNDDGSLAWEEPPTQSGAAVSEPDEA